jgi:hypothetical protein
MELINEFARVRVEVENKGRLRIFSPRFNRELVIDPMEMDFLTLLDQEELIQLVKDVIVNKYQREPGEF